MFENPVMDITWLKEPSGFLCCSMDGTVAYLELTNDEVGQPLDKSEIVCATILFKALSTLDSFILSLAGKVFQAQILIRYKRKLEQKESQRLNHKKQIS